MARPTPSSPAIESYPDPSNEQPLNSQQWAQPTHLAAHLAPPPSADSVLATRSKQVDKIVEMEHWVKTHFGMRLSYFNVFSMPGQYIRLVVYMGIAFECSDLALTLSTPNVPSRAVTLPPDPSHSWRVAGPDHVYQYVLHYPCPQTAKALAKEGVCFLDATLHHIITVANDGKPVAKSRSLGMLVVTKQSVSRLLIAELFRRSPSPRQQHLFRRWRQCTAFYQNKPQQSEAEASLPLFLMPKIGIFTPDPDAIAFDW